MKNTAKMSLLLLFIIVISITGCKKKEKPMVDMNSIRTDGSIDDRYLFRKEIEKEEQLDGKKKQAEPDFK